MTSFSAFMENIIFFLFKMTLALSECMVWCDIIIVAWEQAKYKKNARNDYFCELKIILILFSLMKLLLE